MKNGKIIVNVAEIPELLLDRLAAAALRMVKDEIKAEGRSHERLSTE